MGTATMIISADSWQRVDGALTLPDEQVHLWRADLKQHVRRLRDYAAVMSDEERFRADRFRFDRDRDMYVLSRGVLRLLLAAYTGERADALEFVYGAQGKPALDMESTVEFNLSHSGDLCVLAFAHHTRVGVDIEEKARQVSYMDLAQRFFSEDERREMAGMTSEEIGDAFYAVWTRKEAYIKALGEGVTHGLDNFAVTVDPTARKPTVVSRRDPEARDRWQMLSFEPDAGFAGAIAFERGHQRIVALDYHSEAIQRR